jgi:hypothetical protein
MKLSEWASLSGQSAESVSGLLRDVGEEVLLRVARRPGTGRRKWL